MTQWRQARPKFKCAFDQLRRFTIRQRLTAAVFLSELVNGEPVAALIDQIAREHMHCPRCDGRSFYRHGFANGLQRYRCRDCGRTFNGLSGTPLARLRLKERWLAYFDCLRDPACTVHSAAGKVGVHPNTSFRWRHRFLQWTKLDRPACLTGIVEADETFLLESQKGHKHLTRMPRKRGGNAARRAMLKDLVNIVVARDRSGGTVDFIAGRGALASSALHTHLLPKLARDIMLATNSNGAFKRFALEAGLMHQTADARYDGRPCGATHLQNVSEYMGRFKDWLCHFNGVATCYLENYLGWRWAIDQGRIADAPRFLKAALGVSTANGESGEDL